MARRIIRAAMEQGIPLEINFLGLWQGRNYPNPAFWRIAGEVGNQVIFGCDAHLPEQVWWPDNLQKARRLVRENRLNLIETAALRRPADAQAARPSNDI